ncbi:unnamed protein product [Lepidochelys kempii]
MSYDRYLAICNPLHYTAKMTKGVYIGLTLICWLCGIFIPLGNTAGLFSLPFCGSNQIDFFFCDFPPVLKLYHKYKGKGNHLSVYILYKIPPGQRQNPFTCKGLRN